MPIQQITDRPLTSKDFDYHKGEIVVRGRWTAKSCNRLPDCFASLVCRLLSMVSQQLKQSFGPVQDPFFIGSLN